MRNQDSGSNCFLYLSTGDSENEAFFRKGTCGCWTGKDRKVKSVQA
jgi:hypothetical protein